MCVCVHWGEGGIQQEPKDNSGHLIGMVCVCVFIGGRGGFSKSQRTIVVILQVWCVCVCVCVCVCGFIGGKGGWVIQQEPKDNSGHLTGMVCVCVCVCSLGGGGDSARAKGL